MPALVVAMAGKPASSTNRALATSQALGRTRRRGPWCRARNASAFCRCVDGMGSLLFLGRGGRVSLDTQTYRIGRNVAQGASVVDSARLARTGLVVLTCINLFNYVDRYVVAALGESLRHSPLHVSDPQVGLPTSGFIVVYMLAAPVFGTLGDRGSRARLIAAGIFIWSVATAVGGLAWSFVSLLGARALVGIGEAAYGTISPSLLADYFPRRYRGRVFSIFFAAIPVGTALGYVVA